MGALVSLCQRQSGRQTPDPRVYRQFIRRPEPLCVMTLVDLSGSTQGRVLHAQQRALVLFAEGLRSLSLSHAFYGFNALRLLVYELRSSAYVRTTPLQTRSSSSQSAPGRTSATTSPSQGRRGNPALQT